MGAARGTEGLERGEKRIGWPTQNCAPCKEKLEKRGGRSIDDDDSEADPMWVSWLVEWLRARDDRRGAVIQYGISVGKSLQLHERAKEKGLVKEWTSEEPKKE